jgi:hypothetical protein
MLPIPTALRAAFFAALLTLCAPVSAQAEPAPGAAGWLYETETVADVDLTLPQSSLDGLAAEPAEFQPGTISLHAAGRSHGPLQVGIRLEDEAPLGQKAGFEVKLDEYVAGQSIAGVERLTLDNMAQDATRIREALAYEAFRRLGVPAPRTGYALVSVNGAEYGLYLNIETLDLVSLPRWFASTRHLYEGGSGTDIKPGDVLEFEADDVKGDEREDLEALSDAVVSEDGDWSEGLAGLADLDEMTTMWAVERYVGHWDGYASDREGDPGDYYLHSDASGIFRMLPWGTDQTWDRRVPFDARGALMFDRCLADDSCEASYREALRRVRVELAPGPLADRARRLAALVAPLRAGDTLGEHTDGEFGEGVEDLLSFIAERPRELGEFLGEQTEAGRAQGTNRVTRAHARFGRLRVRRTTVRSRVTVPVAGVIDQRGLARIGGRRATVCSIRGKVNAGETVIVVCRLTYFAIQWLRRGPLTVQIRTCFLSSRGGGACEAPRSVRLRRLTRG